MHDNTDPTTVVFRKWFNDEIIALFPHERAEEGYCRAYERQSKHGSADYKVCISNTVMANKEESVKIRHELEGLGYRLNVRQSVTHHV